MHWIDRKSKFQYERSLQLPIRSKSLDTGEKDHTKNFPGS